MHAETLAYLLHRLPHAVKSGPAPHASADDYKDVHRNELLTVPGGRATLGRRHEDGFGWDNEFEEHSVDVPGFRINRHKVTNGEYLRFVESGGVAPQFWLRSGSGWMLRCMFGDIPLPLRWPVYVTQRQAAAYAAYSGLQLPTEAQFHRAAYGTAEGVEREYPWGNESPEFVPGNFGFRAWDPVAVDATPGSDSSFGAAQMVGNGWEWTSTVFAPFDGFRQFSTYPGYSSNFLRRRAFRVEGRISEDRGTAVAAIIPQLVPA